MSLECPRQCIRIHGHAGVGDDLGHVRIGQAAGDVVDERRAGVERGRGHRGPGRVDAGRDAVGGEFDGSPATTRAHSVAASIRSAPGRVDSPPTSTRAAPCACIRRACATRVGETRVPAAVGERVRRDVEDAHHDRVTRAATERSVNAAVAP